MEPLVLSLRITLSEVSIQAGDLVTVQELGVGYRC